MPLVLHSSIIWWIAPDGLAMCSDMWIFLFWSIWGTSSGSFVACKLTKIMFFILMKILMSMTDYQGSTIYSKVFFQLITFENCKTLNCYLSSCFLLIMYHFCKLLSWANWPGWHPIDYHLIFQLISTCWLSRSTYSTYSAKWQSASFLNRRQSASLLVKNKHYFIIFKLSSDTLGNSIFW